MPVMEQAEVAPPRRLAPMVARYYGYRYEGFPAGTHLGLPSPYLTVVVSLGKPTRTTEAPDGSRPPVDFAALAGGLHTRPALIEHDGDQYGVQLALTPEGCRSLFGMPAGELASAVVPLDSVLGSRSGELIERMGEVTTWQARFAILNEVLLRHADARPSAAPELRRAWSLLSAQGGGARIADVARDVGWSRRHLGERFAAEYGLTPKEAARVMRFARSKLLLQRRNRPALADIAAACGYYDQAHLAREWNDLIGRPPSAWLTGEDLPFIREVDG